MDNLFSTHPATENRIAALAELAREMPGAGFVSSATAARRAPAGPWNRRPAGPWG
jgi:heat shock protein HtpX